jgi:hypothetical protein
MFHPQLKAAIRFFLISILLILPAKIAGACSCPPRANVLDAYEAADEVLIVRVLSVAAVDQTARVRSQYGRDFTRNCSGQGALFASSDQGFNRKRFQRDVYFSGYLWELSRR